MPLVTLTPVGAEIYHRDLAHRVTTSLTLVGSSGGSLEPILRPLPATGHDADRLDVDDLDLGYDAEKFPY